MFGKLITVLLSQVGKCKLNEKNNYASNFDEKHVLLWYEINRRKEIDIYRKFKFLSFYFLAFYNCRKCDTPNVNFYLPTKKRFL